jgi:hypothetical protein
MKWSKRRSVGESNGKRRLHPLTEHLRSLPAALDLEPHVIAVPVEETKVKAAQAKAAAKAAADKRWREAFEPHVIILTELTVPSQITICGLVRGERGRWIVAPKDVHQAGH